MRGAKVKREKEVKREKALHSLIEREKSKESPCLCIHICSQLMKHITCNASALRLKCGSYMNVSVCVCALAN